MCRENNMAQNDEPRGREDKRMRSGERDGLTTLGATRVPAHPFNHTKNDLVEMRMSRKKKRLDAGQKRECPNSLKSFMTSPDTL